MIPRAGVGLVFASIGASLTFGAVVILVIVTAPGLPH